MWVGLGCNNWGVGVQCRWEKGLGLRVGLGLGLGLGLGELEEKWREKEKRRRKYNKRTKCFYLIQNISSIIIICLVKKKSAS